MYNSARYGRYLFIVQILASIRVINVSCTFMSHLELPRTDFLLFSLITGKYPALAQIFEVYGYLCEIRLNFKPRTGRNVDVVLGNN